MASSTRRSARTRRAPDPTAAGRHRHPAPRARPALLRRPGARRLAIALAPLAIGAAGSWIGTIAAFTDSVASSATFSAGTVQIKANGAATTYAFTALSASGLVPGATPTYALLTVSDTGTAPLTYTMSTTATANQLTTDLKIGIVRIAGATCDAAAYTGGTALYTEAAGLTAASVASRSLAAGGSENLCFKVSLPSTSTNSSQGLTTSATFTFAATS